MNEKDNWDLTLIYKDENDFNNSKEELYKKLEKLEKFQGILCDSAENLYEAYKLIEEAEEIYEKIYAYGMLNYHLDMSNQESLKLFKIAENVSADFSTAISFVTPELIEADEQKILKFLSEKKELEAYEVDIKETLEKKKHVLSKAEENLISQYSEVFANSENTFDIFTGADLKYGKIKNEEGNEVELTDSNYTNFMKSKNKTVRKEAFSKMYENYEKYINTFAELYLSRVKYSTITARIRKYKSSLENAVLDDDASIKVYESMIDAINKNMEVNHKFISLKRKILDEKEMHFYDIYYNPVEKVSEKITYDESKNKVLNALEIMGEEYVNLLKTAFDNRWIDVYEKENKRSGAYSLGLYGVQPFVLTNFVGDSRDTSTIAHELGHAIHSYYSNTNQNVINANYTIMVAEVASTVNELLLASYEIENESDKNKKAALLYEMLEMIRATLFRQAMFAEFEKCVHEKMENGEMLSADDLNGIYLDLNKKYFGEDIVLDKEIQFEWARIPHFYSCFYVYKYATGISCAIAIASRILRKEPGFTQKYINMLKQGKTKKSIDLLKMVDIDMEDISSYEEAIKFYESKINELEIYLNKK